LPELPDARRARFEAEYSLTASEAMLLTETRAEADAFEEAVHLTQRDGSAGADRARAVAHWFIGDVARLLHPEGGEVELSTTLLTPAHIAELVTLVEGGTITLTTAKEVLEIAFASGAHPTAIVEERGLGRVRDEGEIDRIAREVIEANAKPVADYRSGKAAAVQFLVGQVMRQTRGRADANSVAEVLRRHLDEGK
jgi:aspartyl-tRNA(Asn)/glutamyl-tRNA(Gln) amidotransferase subunit B